MKSARGKSGEFSIRKFSKVHSKLLHPLILKDFLFLFFLEKSLFHSLPVGASAIHLTMIRDKSVEEIWQMFHHYVIGSCWPVGAQIMRNWWGICKFLMARENRSYWKGKRVYKLWNSRAFTASHTTTMQLSPLLYARPSSPAGEASKLLSKKVENKKIFILPFPSLFHYFRQTEQQRHSHFHFLWSFSLWHLRVGERKGWAELVWEGRNGNESEPEEDFIEMKKNLFLVTSDQTWKLNNLTVVRVECS